MADDVQRLIDALAIEITRPAGLDDKEFRALAYSPHDDADIVDAARRESILRKEAPAAVRRWLTQDRHVAAAQGPVRLPSNEALGMKPRVCVPVRYKDVLFGYLWIVDVPEPLGEVELNTTERYATEIAAEMYLLRRQTSEYFERESRAVRGLLFEDLDSTRSAEAYEDELASAGRYTVIVGHYPHGAVCDPAAHARLSTLAEKVRRTTAPSRALTFVNGEWLVVVLGFDHDHDLERCTKTLTACAEEMSANDESVFFGVGTPVQSPAELRKSYSEARSAARVAGALDRPSCPLSWGELGSYRVIVGMLQDLNPLDVIPESVRRLMIDRDSWTLIQTVEAYLDGGADAGATAAKLDIHRSSLYNRLRKVEKVAGIALTSGDARLELQIGLRIRRLAVGGWTGADT